MRARSARGAGDVETMGDLGARLAVETQSRQQGKQWRRIADLVPRICPIDGCAIRHVHAVGIPALAPHVVVTFQCGHSKVIDMPAGATLGVGRSA
ncbi:MAG: hypothetical protein WDM94_09360 [Bauldia sp.]